MEFSRPEYWSGWLFPSPGDLPNPGIKSMSPTLQVDSLPSEPQGCPVRVPSIRNKMPKFSADCTPLSGNSCSLALPECPVSSAGSAPYHSTPASEFTLLPNSWNPQGEYAPDSPTIPPLFHQYWEAYVCQIRGTQLFPERNCPS